MTKFPKMYALSVSILSRGNDSAPDWWYLTYMTSCCLLIEKCGGMHSLSQFSDFSTVLCHPVAFLIMLLTSSSCGGCSAPVTTSCEERAHSNEEYKNKDELIS